MAANRSNLGTEVIMGKSNRKKTEKRLEKIIKRLAKQVDMW